MNHWKKEIPSLDSVPEAAQDFLNFIKAQPYKFLAFYGNMGAGKTTFISALLKKMQLDDHSASPTFALVNEYQSTIFGKIYHCDFYRLKTPEEALDIGFEDMIADNAWILAEWPEKLGNLLPSNCVNVKITDQNGCRLIEATV